VQGVWGGSNGGKTDIWKCLPPLPFYMSSNEVAFAKAKQEQFYIYRLYDYSKGGSAFYVISGDPVDSFHLTPRSVSRSALK
jgi:Domain of unknown function (DUF3883)